MSGEQNSRKMRRSSRRLNREGGGAIVLVEHGWVEPTRSDSQFNTGVRRGAPAIRGLIPESPS